MASRTVVDSVDVVEGPPREVAALEAQLDELRRRFPGAILERYLDRVPRAAERVRIAPGAAVIGDVSLGEAVSIWYGCVLRGDVNRIEIRERSNVQDGTVIHLGDHSGTFVAEEVVIGHRAVIHGCRIGDLKALRHLEHEVASLHAAAVEHGADLVGETGLELPR